MFFLLFKIASLLKHLQPIKHKATLKKHLNNFQ